MKKSLTAIELDRDPRGPRPRANRHSIRIPRSSHESGIAGVIDAIRARSIRLQATLAALCRSEAIVLAAILSLALVVRLLLLVKADWMIDLDEALIGLMGIDITKGDRPIFLNGQPYLGAFEPYVAAGLFTIFGVSREILKLVALAMSLVWTLTTYLLARRLWDRRSAALAAVTAAVPPLYVLSTTLRAWGATIETMVLGNLILLCAVAAADTSSQRQRTRWYAALGLSIGLGFWLHWLIAYFVISGLLYLLIRKPAFFLKQDSWTALPAFALGSLPLWLYNVRHPWATFRYFLYEGKPHGDGAGQSAIFWDLISRLIPRVFGAESPVGHWLAWPGAVIVLAALLLLFGHCLQARRKGEPSPAEVIAFLIVSVPMLYMISGFGVSAINPWGIDNAGRYVVPLFVAGPLALAFLARSASRRVALAATIVVCLVNLAGILSADGRFVFQSPYYNRAPTSFRPVIAALQQAGIRRVWAEAGLGQPLMFESREAILSADYWLEISGGTLRFPAAQAAVKEADRTAYLVAIQPGQIGPLENDLQRHEIPYRKHVVENLAILIPTRPVAPAEVADGLGHQY